MRKLKMGMIGGGIEAFIGAVHRKAAALDGQIELVAGAFSSNEEKSKQTGEQLFLNPERVYKNYEEMLTKEANMPSSERLDFVSIVTPNHVHYAPAQLALEKGFHVMLDKPLTFTVEEAEKLEKLVQETGLFLGVTYTYTGYPLVHEAKFRVKRGDFGKIRKFLVEYPQGWLSERIEQQGQKQAEWRTDPARSGKSGCIGDIGTHAANLVETITNQRITEVCALLNTVVENRRLDDDGMAFLRLENGATGVLVATQVAAGEENALKIKVYGEKGGLEWHQQEPNTLILSWLDKPKQILRTGSSFVESQECRDLLTRLPAGHPEGYLEAFANIYTLFSKAILAKNKGEDPKRFLQYVPNVQHGLEGMRFVEAMVKSSQSKQKWVQV